MEMSLVQSMPIKKTYGFLRSVTTANTRRNFNYLHQHYQLFRISTINYFVSSKTKHIRFLKHACIVFDNYQFNYFSLTYQFALQVIGPCLVFSMVLDKLFVCRSSLSSIHIAGIALIIFIGLLCVNTIQWRRVLT